MKTMQELQWDNAEARRQAEEFRVAQEHI